MGEVYRARDPRLSRDVAIKVLPESLAGDAERLRRFEHEARAAGILNHPNLTSVYDVGREGRVSYVVEELLEGETLRAALVRGPLPPLEALDVGVQIARGLAAAHGKGIVHRDLKPENLFRTREGRVKILDFGLAKLALEPVTGEVSRLPTASALTAQGVVLGTLAYMSPEQLRGDARVDSRCDVFSFGVVLYEMLTGLRPFDAASPAETLSRILTHEPAPMAAGPEEIPAGLQSAVARALQKKPEDRFRDAGELLGELEALRDDLEFRARLARTDSGAPPGGPGAARRRRRLAAAVGLLGAVAIFAAAAVWIRRSRLAWAADSVPRVAQLAREGHYAEALDLAQRVLRYRPNDAEITRLLPTITDDLSVSTEPPGAEVFVRRYEPRAEAAAEVPRSLGRTPLSHAALPRGDYILRVELAGYEPFERTVSSAVARSEFKSSGSPQIEVAWTLRESGKVPVGMVAVPGGPYKLVGYGQPTGATVRLGDFFLDRYEVTNREFAEFVNAGGYRNRAFWRHPFVKDGRTLSWEEALQTLVDRTGLPGPRGWTGGRAPEGMDDHPVTGVTWYEAAAYAAFRGKTLPSVFQWEKAARDGEFIYTSAWVMPWGLAAGGNDRRANFDSKATVPVGQMPFGMSPFGCYGMAGNVSEWILNETPGGFLTAGGSFGDPPYIFGDYGTKPAFFSSDRLGFRCALRAAGAGADDGSARITVSEQAPTYTRSSEADFRAWLSHYRYDRTPLEARVEEKVATPDWTREKVSFTGAGGARVPAWLYLPKDAKPPFQVIQFVPGSGAYYGEPSNAFVENGRLSPHVKAGRAIFIVDLPGYAGRERPPGYQRPDFRTIAFRERVVREATDLRRGLDYLETRPEIDMKKLAFMNVSIAAQGIIFAAVEPRYRSVVLLADGLYADQANWVAEANPVNLAPHIRPPKLMLNGRWDEDFAFRTDAEPLFKLLAEPKRLELYDGGHVPPPEIAVPAVNRWLDETLGPVRHE